MDGRVALWVIAVAAASVASDSATWSQCPDVPPDSPTLLVPTRSLHITKLNLINCTAKLQQTTFKNVPNLQVINLANISLSDSDKDIFKFTPRLEELYFSKNILEGGTLKLPNLKKIIITDTDLSNVDLVGPGQDLIMLQLDNCSLSAIPTYVTFGSFPSMVKLILPRNNIETLQDWDMMGNTINLKELDLGHNLIRDIPEDFFAYALKIDTIDLRNNKLRHLPERLFLNTPALMSINLRGNLIEHVPAGLFKNTSPLTIDLSYNMITYLPDDFLIFIDMYKSPDLFLDHNPWQCGCLNEILVKLKRKYINYLPEDKKEFQGKEPVCVMASFHCFKPENHVRFYKKMKEW